MVLKFADRCSLCLPQSPNKDDRLEWSDAVIGQQWLENSRREQLRRDKNNSMRERIVRAAK
ncbi:14e62305-07c1-4721-b9e6-55ef4ceba5e4-CDS [Sclerotinia trifoliorum]|uniref:14e62305-07c1-4721-b9e6-55ef4ceba5e4-CDS n=1 Tax=Sclerotinia trifoliorum TaxID=28548 RepID=A0A8H2VTN7_9HELO|nr:14e62305-07c1-4721-b9e6-55ef4ceba5e4-CDS [Sclerotinia trifoliorum]